MHMLICYTSVKFIVKRKLFHHGNLCLQLLKIWMSFQRYIHDYYVYQLVYYMCYFIQYIRKENPNAFEILRLDLKLSSQSYVEFDFEKHSKKTPCGWEINPLIDTTRVRNILQ